MATKQINQYNAASTIDAVSDQLLIDPAGTGNYLKINRNTYLGVAGTPMDISTTQNVSNKTFQNSNSYTAKDGSLTLQNTADTTKQAKFSLSGITTGNTRTITLPDYNATMASLAGTETLTNKTLTAPTISGGSIDNATVTVDAVSGHTSSNTGTIYGISISSAAINSSSAFGNSVILPSALMTGTGSSWAWQSWTPTLSNLSGGTLTYAKYVQIGKTVHFRFKYTLAGAGITGSVDVTLPVAAFAGATTSDYMDGSAVFQHTGVSTFLGPILFLGTASVRLQYLQSTSQVTNISSSVPFTWANTDVISAVGSYEAA